LAKEFKYLESGFSAMNEILSRRAFLMSSVGAGLGLGLSKRLESAALGLASYGPPEDSVLVDISVSADGTNLLALVRRNDAQYVETYRIGDRINQPSGSIVLGDDFWGGSLFPSKVGFQIFGSRISVQQEIYDYTLSFTLPKELEYLRSVMPVLGEHVVETPKASPAWIEVDTTRGIVVSEARTEGEYGEVGVALSHLEDEVFILGTSPDGDYDAYIRSSKGSGGQMFIDHLETVADVTFFDGDLAFVVEPREGPSYLAVGPDRKILLNASGVGHRIRLTRTETQLLATELDLDGAALRQTVASGTEAGKEVYFPLDGLIRVPDRFAPRRFVTISPNGEIRIEEAS
jgi:hypothetical protein